MDKVKTMLATFAGGCFWCMVEPFSNLLGIIKVISGYTGGTTINPSYEEVCSGDTGHTEAIQLSYDPKKINYEMLLDIYWKQTNPMDALGQFSDRGSSYRPIIFYHTPEQCVLAELSKQQLEQTGRFPKQIVTQILPAQPFYPAESYHQDFYQKSPARYHSSRINSGRDSFIKKYWGVDE